MITWRTHKNRYTGCIVMKYKAMLTLSKIEHRLAEVHPVKSNTWLFANRAKAAIIPIMQSFSSQAPPFLL